MRRACCASSLRPGAGGSEPDPFLPRATRSLSAELFERGQGADSRRRGAGSGAPGRSLPRTLRFTHGRGASGFVQRSQFARPSLGPLLHCLSASATLVDTNGLCRAVPGTARAGRITHRRRRLWLNARNAAVTEKSPVRNARARGTCPVRRRITPPLPRVPRKACVRDAMAAGHRIAHVATARERFTRDRRIEEAPVVRIR